MGLESGKGEVEGIEINVKMLLRNENKVMYPLKTIPITYEHLLHTRHYVRCFTSIILCLSD